MLKEGMSHGEFSGIVSEAHSKLGASCGAFASFGEPSAFPHGSSTPQELKKGDVILMDCGCKVGG